MRAGNDIHPRPWERLPGEPARGFALFTAYLSTSPRSLRAALARIWRDEGRASESARVPGSYQRMADYWRYIERAAAWDLHVAEEEHDAFQEARKVARTKRRARLEKLGTLFDRRLEKLHFQRLAPRHFVQELVRVHAAQRTELGEDVAGEDRPTGSLPAIEDRIKPPPEP